MNANLMIDVFTNTTHTNKLELGKLVSLLLTLLEELRPGDDGLRRSIVNVTKGRLFGELNNFAFPWQSTYIKTSRLLSRERDPPKCGS